jgi:hypothetical protein
VLYVSGEDHAGRALKPRLQLAGADLELVHFLNPDGPGFSVAAVVDLLERQAVTMVVLDPMSLFVDVAAPLENGELATRQALKPLVRLAQEHGLAVVGIKHLRKEPSGSNPFDAIIGSRAYTAASRSVLFFTRDPENAGRAGGLIYSRGNYAAATDGVRYRLDVDSVELDDGNLGRHPLFVAEESVSSRTLEEVLGASATREDTSETAACTRWLDDFLYGQPPIDSREVKERADDEGFSEKMLRRAREELGVVVEHTGFGRDKRSYWSLPTSINALDAHKCPSPDEGIYGE